MFDAGGLKVGVGGWGSKGLSSDTLVHSHTRDNVTAVPVNLRNQERTFTLHTENLFLQRMKGLKSKFQRSQLHFSQNSQQSAGGDFCSASPGCSNTPPTSCWLNPPPAPSTSFTRQSVRMIPPFWFPWLVFLCAVQLCIVAQSNLFSLGPFQPVIWPREWGGGGWWWCRNWEIQGDIKGEKM